jgi:hypothetical protein
MAKVHSVWAVRVAEKYEFTNLLPLVGNVVVREQQFGMEIKFNALGVMALDILWGNKFHLTLS